GVRVVKKFYVYVYYDPRPGVRGRFSYYDAPILVGKGSGNRSKHHWGKLRRKHPNDILRKILAQCEARGLEPRHEIVARFDCPFAAFDCEKKLIAKYGRRCNNTGTLCNIHPGGVGFAVADKAFQMAVRRGYARVKDAVGKMNGARLRKMNRTKAFLDKIKAGRPAAIKKAVATRAQKSASDPHFYDELSAAVGRTWENKKTRAKRIAGIRATSRKPSSRAKRRAAWTPERRAKQAAVAAKANRDPAAKAARARGVKNSWGNPVI